MRTSINTWVFGFDHPIEDAVRRIAGYGFQGVEVPFRDTEMRWTGSQKKHLLESTRGSGLQVATLLVALGMLPPENGRNLSSSDSTLRRQAVEFCLRGLDLACELDADRVVLNVGKLEEGQGEEDACAFAVDSIRSLLDRAPEGRWKAVLENFPDRWIGPAAKMRALIERVASPRFGGLLDTGHQNVLKEPFRDALREVGAALFHLHLNNNSGDQDSHHPPSDGTLSRMDFLDNFRALRQAGYDGWYSFEVFGADRGRDPDLVCRDCTDLIAFFNLEGGL
ncbi:MAG: sugar phosphate isomerase/epimerase [Coprothermobacterota bacterium]|nr:sugar phosphate isomerase/epimerase [Coprothermobacterota bacterium]